MSSDQHRTLPPIPIGASAQDVLAALLPPVVQAASDSAPAATAAANTSIAVEQRLGSFQGALDRNTAEIAKLTSLWDRQQTDLKDRGDWLRSIVTPQTIFWLVALVLGLLGIRMTIPVPFEIPASSGIVLDGGQP